MKRNNQVSSSGRKSRKRYFAAPSHLRRKMMSVPLSKELRLRHGIRAIPIKKGDEVKVTRGFFKGTIGKVSDVYRLRFVIYIDSVRRTKANGTDVPVPLHPSNVVLVKFPMHNSRQIQIERRCQGRVERSQKCS
ncbi:60S ribosomal protein L26-A [Folsomia candida]|uniref:KOW domain-containing protein n=1 Tax=Folsomia candida TaxID=158441 RepID=A0A226DJM1_FOLCA|nr:60S ribosomal protein L26-A [Folsomia candida]XP_035713421.1 60S ribosomal protein L26-A [Folsomia candida]OXA45463.1 hypothetical protein Fcan01_19520 [Folsomia candida]